ncbi:MAG: molybdopterin-guanine dinucleotide biosynthesis protein B [Methylophilaceae bacterium]
MNKLPILGIVAASSNAGKTTVITRLLPALAKHNIRVSVIKHAHHQFDIDHPGKDSYNIREAGAVQTLIASGKRWALMTEMTRTQEASHDVNLDALLNQLNPDYADLVLAEGFKQAKIPKIEVYRPSLGLPLLADSDDNIIAVATDEPINCTTPQLMLNDTQALCQFIIQWIQTTS